MYSHPSVGQADLSIKGEAAGANGQDSWVNETGSPVLIESIKLDPQATSAADGTNYATLTASIDGTSIGTRATSADPLTAGTAEYMTLSGTLVVPAGGRLKIAKTYSGTGVAINTKAFVKYRPVRSVS